MGSHLASVVFRPDLVGEYEELENTIWLTTSRGNQIPAIYISQENARFTVVFSHGNAQNLLLLQHWYFLDRLSEQLNVNLLYYDYTGYGPPGPNSRSQTKPSEADVYADIEAVFEYLHRRVPWNDIVLYGFSLGTAPSIHWASRYPVRGVILQSPLASIYRISLRLRFTLPGDFFNSIDKIGKVCCPVLLFHGTKDSIVPAWHAQDLHRICMEKGTAVEACVIEGADHNDLLETVGEGVFLRKLEKFLHHLQETPISAKLRQQAQHAFANDNSCFRWAPPIGPLGRTNSWLYVPLLLAAAGRLHLDIVEEWQRNPRAIHFWQDAVERLQAAPALPWEVLHSMLSNLQELRREEKQKMSADEEDLPNRLLLAGSKLPVDKAVDLRWAVNQLSLPNGYMPASVQETLLMAYLGYDGASTLEQMARTW
eukprot:Skav232988  [mRNA]  locus=scaffold1735:615636:616910:+ [translate_table: standard]